MTASAKGAGRILVVDDEPRMAAAIVTALERSGHRCLVATRGDQALELFAEHGADLVVTDRRMPGIDGIDLMSRLLELQPELPVILVTAFGDVRSAVDAMRKGAFDYLTKPFDLDELRQLVQRALELDRLRRENRQLRRQLIDRQAGSLIAESQNMLDVLDLVDRAAGSDATVLIQGESGTGKEVIARRLHAGSERAGGPFVAINVGALATGVIESELFGHRKGAFTGAESSRMGCFERANGGSLFLDEIGDLAADVQVKLLRVLQECEVLPVGADEPVAIDARVIAASHHDLLAAVDDGRFRQDLYYRLRVIPVDLPPLRDRLDDVLPLAESFLARSLGSRHERLQLTRGAVDALLAHPWPGNVRELQNAIERAAVLTRGRQITEHDLLLTEPRQQPADSDNPNAQTLQDSLDRAASERIRQALASHRGHRRQVADELGIDRTTLFRWIRRLDLLNSG